MQGRQLELGVPRTTEGDLRRVPHDPEAWEPDARPPGGGASGAEILRRNPMMTHLLEALERGENIGRYGEETADSAIPEDGGVSVSSSRKPGAGAGPGPGPDKKEAAYV